MQCCDEVFPVLKTVWKLQLFRLRKGGALHIFTVNTGLSWKQVSAGTSNCEIKFVLAREQLKLVQFKASIQTDFVEVLYQLILVPPHPSIKCVSVRACEKNRRECSPIHEPSGWSTRTGKKHELHQKFSSAVFTSVTDVNVKHIPTLGQPPLGTKICFFVYA